MEFHTYSARSAKPICLGFLLIVGGSINAFASSEVDLVKAEKQFKRSCGTCHTVAPGATQRQGPHLTGVIGRTAGSLSHFTKYSDALKAAGTGGLVWTAETLDPWLTNARKFIPKTNMSYRQRNAEKRALVIEYLKSLQPPSTNQ